MLKKDVFISIKGVQYIEGQLPEVTELMTEGSLIKKGETYYISYNESETTGFEGSKTTLKIDPDRVLLQRTGAYASNLIIEKGRRHQCAYSTGYGELLIGVFGNYVNSTLTENGGDLQFRYSLDINTSLTSENEVFINVKE